MSFCFHYTLFSWIAFPRWVLVRPEAEATAARPAAIARCRPLTAVSRALTTSTLCLPLPLVGKEPLLKGKIPLLCHQQSCPNPLARSNPIWKGAWYGYADLALCSIPAFHLLCFAWFLILLLLCLFCCSPPWATDFESRTEDTHLHHELIRIHNV